MSDTSAVTQGGRARQRAEVWNCIRDQNWWTLYAIAERTGNPAQSVSARLRDFRKKRYGERNIERRYLGDGVFEYRWVP